MQLVMQKIDRRSKPIKKQHKSLDQSLKRKMIKLDDENFDIF